MNKNEQDAFNKECAIFEKLLYDLLIKEKIQSDVFLAVCCHFIAFLAKKSQDPEKAIIQFVKNLKEI